MKQVKRIYGNLKASGILYNFLNLGGIQVSNMLLALLSIIVVTRIIGIEAVGLVTSSYRFALLAGSAINYGTGQSGVRDTALHRDEPEKLSVVFFNTLSLRALAFLIFISLLFTLQFTGLLYSKFILFSLPVVLAEVVNPLCFYIGVEKLKIFNIYNLIANASTLLAIILIINGAHNALYINFILGTANIIIYTALLAHFVVSFKLKFKTPRMVELLKMAKDNFYLTVNNASANLQQNVIIFALSEWGTPAVLGAYSISDRFIGQIRNILNIIANAIYPKAVLLYKEGEDLWITYRRKVKLIFMGVFIAGALLTIILADYIILVLSKQHDATAVLILRTMACVPVISVLNTINTLDQLIKKRNVFIFRIAAVLLLISTLTAVLLSNSGNTFLIGTFTIIVELSACVMYEYIITKTEHTHE